MAKIEEVVAGAVIGVLQAIITVGFILFFNYPIMLLVNATFSPAFLTFVFGVAHVGFWKTLILSYTLSILLKQNNAIKATTTAASKAIGEKK